MEKVGDPQEAKAIYNAYCAKPKRQGTLPIGLLKSNIGHAEGASGVSSITKVLLAYENECIPPNQHLKNLKSSIKEFCPPLVPINENYKYTPGMSHSSVKSRPRVKIQGKNCYLLYTPKIFLLIKALLESTTLAWEESTALYYLPLITRKWTLIASKLRTRFRAWSTFAPELRPRSRKCSTT